MPTPKYSLWLIAMLLLVLSPLAVRAQESKGQTTSITGCLQKGVETGGFTIFDDGKMWELFGNVDATHVGHKVTVQGHELHLPPAEEAKHADTEKQESSGKTYADFQVNSLKMVSASCQ